MCILSLDLDEMFGLVDLERSNLDSCEPRNVSSRLEKRRKLWGVCSEQPVCKEQKFDCSRTSSDVQ